MNKTIEKKYSLNGEVSIPGDKSISHRAVMFGSIAKGVTEISNFLTGEDCLSTISCFKKMGIDISVDKTNVTVHGKGLYGLSKPLETLDVGNSGTTLRLISGILAAQNFKIKITGDSSIQGRPMDRISNPLSLMGTQIKGTIKNSKLYAPLEIEGKKLNPISYTLPVASAQVKSSIILASLYAEGETVIVEPEPTRDHTEIMLNYLGADIKREENKIICNPVSQLYGKEIQVPSDISSAAYFMVGGAICPDSKLTLKNIGVNPTRAGIIEVLKNMGAKLTLTNQKIMCGELVADCFIESSSLKGTIVEGSIIPTLIDEIPVIAVAAAFAEGETIIKNAEELKVKESNRIKTVVTELKKFGVDIEETEDGMIIRGKKALHGAVCESYNDHRIAMSLAIMGIMTGDTTIVQSECVDISFPNFFQTLEEL